MNNKKLLIVLIILAVVLVAAIVIYPILEQNYAPALPVKRAVSEGTGETEAATETVPELTVLDGEGNTVSLSSLFGKPLVMNFWATWCGPCRRELPFFQAAYDEHGEDITFVMVNLTDGSRDTAEGVRTFLQDNGYSLPVYYDTAMAALTSYGIRSVPVTVFVNPDGTAFDVFSGSISEDTLNAYIAELLSAN